MANPKRKPCLVSRVCRYSNFLFLQNLLPQQSHVRLTIYNLLGQELVTLVNKEHEAGSYQAQFDGEGLASGVYLYRIQAGDFVETKKLLLLK